MKLKNPFSEITRLAWMGHWECVVCGCNGNERGGLELHHIAGRISNSILNSSILCGGCHKRMNHNEKEEKDLFFETLIKLNNDNTLLGDDDREFLNNYDRLREVVEDNRELFEGWLSSQDL